MIARKINQKERPFNIFSEEKDDLVDKFFKRCAKFISIKNYVRKNNIAPDEKEKAFTDKFIKDTLDLATNPEYEAIWEGFKEEAQKRIYLFWRIFT